VLLFRIGLGRRSDSNMDRFLGQLIWRDLCIVYWIVNISTSSNMEFKRTSSEALSTSCGSGTTWAIAACAASTAEVSGALTSSGRVVDFSGTGSAVGIGASCGSPSADPFSTGLSARPGTFSTCSGSTTDSW
jgi:hypothetical protein